jgi:Beta-lactamase enzyme family
MPADLADRIPEPVHEVQMLYTRIDRDADQQPTLTRFPLALAAERWFSAASWVKLPAVLLTAERLTRLGVDASARIALDGPPATGNWTATEPLVETFDRTVRRLFTVSENVPFNRLYEYLGQREIGEALSAHGYPTARLIARLGSGDAERNRSVGATRVVGASGAEVERRDGRTNPDVLSFPFGPVLKGRGWQMDDGSVVMGPHDFSTTNFVPIAAMHDMLAALVFPAAAPASQRWAISPSIRETLLMELSRWPRESTDPLYPAPDYLDGTAKYFIVGDQKANAATSLRLFGKVGQAYGYLQDCAYVVDREAGVEFLLAATIHVNADGIFNDDKYEYDEIGIPFLASLGRAVLAHERERPRTVRPPLTDLPDRWE